MVRGSATGLADGVASCARTPSSAATGSPRCHRTGSGIVFDPYSRRSSSITRSRLRQAPQLVRSGRQSMIHVSLSAPAPPSRPCCSSRGGNAARQLCHVAALHLVHSAAQQYVRRDCIQDCVSARDMHRLFAQWIASSTRAFSVVERRDLVQMTDRCVLSFCSMSLSIRCDDLCRHGRFSIMNGVPAPSASAAW